MAIFSYRMGDRVRRGAGQSAVKVAAYQAREKYTDTRTGYAYNYQPCEKDGHGSARGIAAASAYIDRDSGYQEGRMCARRQATSALPRPIKNAAVALSLGTSPQIHSTTDRMSVSAIGESMSIHSRALKPTT